MPSSRSTTTPLGDDAGDPDDTSGASSPGGRTRVVRIGTAVATAVALVAVALNLPQSGAARG
ncbi:hypothetical protein, partial [Nocardioides sp. R-C-SC26]|uniref:hypothetical protein n=1 Tax=Nocardioides sp. R-C-SC26 TaxID=2870414 RepID=UPI001E42B636